MFSGRRGIPATSAAVGLLAACAGLFGPAPVASAAEPTQQELLEQIKALRARVEQMEADKPRDAQPGAPSRHEASADAGGGGAAAEQATVDSVLRDAERRSNLKPFMFQTGLTDLPAGRDKGKFFIRSPDGQFSFSPTFQFQMRFVGNSREGVPVEDDDGNVTVDDDGTVEEGFELRRMKFGAEGKAFGKFEYKFVWFTNRSGGEVLLEDAVVKYQLAEDVNLVMGQFKDPVHHEELVSSSKQLSADRSLVNEILGGGFTDRVQGVGLEYKRGPWEIFAVFHDGVESLNTNFRDPPANGSDYGAAARVEYVLFGDKKYYGDFTALGNTGDMMAVGGGVDFSGLEDDNALSYTVDWQYEFDRVALYAAFLGQNFTAHGDGDEEDVTNFGGLVQAGYMLTDKWEAFGRYGLVSLDGDAVGDDEADDIHEIVGGVNYYLEGHNAKFTGDVTFLPEGSPGESGLGIINSGGESQAVLRLQFQLLI